MTVRRCPGCRGRLSGNLIVCRSCWRRVPDHVKEDFYEARHVGDRVRQRAAAAAIMQHAIRTNAEARP